MALAAGRLGTPLDLVAGVEAVLYTCGQGGTGAVAATATVSFCNRSGVDVQLRLAVGTGANATAPDYKEYDAPVPAAGVLERTGMAISAGEKIFVRSSVSGVSVRAEGYEK